MMSYLQKVKDYQALVWDKKDLSAIEKFFHDDVIVHSVLKQTQGTEQLYTILKSWHEAFPNMQVSFDDYICQDNRVVSRWRAQGCHEGRFLDFPPTHKTIHYSGVTIYQLTDDKISEYWVYVDMDHVKRQLSHD